MPENQGCSERLMININNLMHEINELTKSYKMLHEVEKEAQSEAAAKAGETPSAAADHQKWGSELWPQSASHRNHRNRQRMESSDEEDTEKHRIHLRPVTLPTRCTSCPVKSG
ncbi:hypothetical protein QTO34_000420 [Cnephaeus nilssonii]|uniref:Uncharacterized protein n=1 Tax=Cnephaeus nilssonii TaxID=3371016 RepID=A0AA40IBJ3_CNENI|nr:hypothetical protein QTO34_000420 [Eptesicus nilssonii]